MNFLKRLFKGKNKETIPEDDVNQEQYDKYYKLKVKGLEAVLGKMYDMVAISIFPFSIGGSAAMYCFPNHINGTGFATLELLTYDGKGPKPNRFGTYELVAFTRQVVEISEDVNTPFNLIKNRICGNLTSVGHNCFEGVFNPGDTYQSVFNMGIEERYMIFDYWFPFSQKFMIGDQEHHLLLCMEIFKSEMEFARKNGSEKLFDLLVQAGYYPYSDLNRGSVA